MKWRKLWHMIWKVSLRTICCCLIVPDIINVQCMLTIVFIRAYEFSVFVVSLWLVISSYFAPKWGRTCNDFSSFPYFVIFPFILTLSLYWETQPTLECCSQVFEDSVWFLAAALILEHIFDQWEALTYAYSHPQRNTKKFWKPRAPSTTNGCLIH